MVEDPVRKTGADQRFFQLGALADADAALVEEGATALAGGKQFVALGIEHHGLSKLPVMGERDRNRVLREAVNEVGGAVQRVDDPLVFGLLAGSCTDSSARIP